MPAVDEFDDDDKDGRLIERLSLTKGPAARDRAWNILQRLKRRNPDLARSLRRLLGRLSSAEEIRVRYEEHEIRRDRCPTLAEIEARSAAVRAKWTDEERQLRCAPHNDGPADRGPGIRVCKAPRLDNTR